MADRIIEHCGALEVILFGSVARGDDGPDSDLDLLGVLPSRLVLRGGPDTLSLIRTHAHRLNPLYVLNGAEVYGISVFAALDDVGAMSYAELLGSRLKGYPLVYTPAVDALLGAGFALLPTFRRPHYTVLMSSLDDTERLYNTLGELLPNPYAVS